MNTAARYSWQGQVIGGRFPLLQWLGGSAPSAVFLTQLSGPGSQKAAIKLIPADWVEVDSQISRWQAIADLSHPHLMRLLHSGRCEIDASPLLYVVTEYAEENLSQILPLRPLTPAEAREMLLPALDALSYLHVRGFVHGHIKPPNIMVVNDQLRLASDGLQQVGEPGKRWVAPSIYDAPELAAGAISPAADVWSLGVTLVEALNQRPPRWERSQPNPPAVPEPVPELFAGIARECLHPDPARRCTLAQIKARLEPAASPPAVTSQTEAPVPTRFPVKWLIVATLVVLAVIAVLKLAPHQAPPATNQKQPPVPAAAPLPARNPVVQTKGVVKGDIAERVLPDVPRSARNTIQGRIKVKIRVLVDADGEVSDVGIESPGPSKYFANLALQAARGWKFKPAQVDGKAVSSQWSLRFQFRRTGTEVAPVETAP